MDREMEAGTPTLFRPIPNEYGTLDSPHEIEFALLKCNGAVFSQEEQIKIETWLTAPKLSTPLYFVPNGKKSITGPIPYYYGVFTKTEWIPGRKGFQSVKLTFMPTTVYPFMKGTIKIELKRDSNKKIQIPKNNQDEYIYPVITLKDHGGSLSIENLSTGEPVMKLTGLPTGSDLSIDCENCFVLDLTNKKILTFTEIGWTKVSDIVWLRLCEGKNELELKGTGTVIIDYEMPYKKVGGWFE